MKKSLSLFILGVLLCFSAVSFAQHSNANSQILTDSLASDSILIDSLSINDQTIRVDVQAINKLLESTEEELLKASRFSNNARFFELDSIFTIKEQFINQEADDFSETDQVGLSKFYLENLKLSWENYLNASNKWQKELGDEMTKLVMNTNNLIDRRDQLEEAYNKLSHQNLNALRKRILAVINDVESAIEKYNKKEKQIFELQTKVAEKNVLMEQVINKIEVLDIKLKNETFSKTQGAIWNIKMDISSQGGFYKSLARAYHNNIKSTRYYLNGVSERILSFIFISILLIFIILYIRKKYIALNLSSETPGHINIDRSLIKNPLQIISVLLISLWIGLFPYIPMVLADTLLFLIVVILGSITKPFIDKKGQKLLFTLSLLLLVNIVEGIIWYFGDYARIFLLFETSLSIVFIFPFLSIYRQKPLDNKTPITYIAKIFIPLVLAAYVIALIGNIFGFINLTVLFIKIGIRTAAITMIAFGYSRVIENISYGLLSLVYAKFPNILHQYGTVIKKRIQKVINIIILFIWLDSVLRLFELRDAFYSWLGNLITTEASLGSISLSIADILLFGGILYFTFLATIFVKKILEGEILRKMKLPRGLPAAISMIFRIFLVSFGILFAFSSTGINISSLGMIVGALGVGIGFGLQNIVQNFISGLILIFERPIQVGDTVEVDSLLGRVKDIGVRASNVVTYDGAEVVVPNANLISNNLINWTLSDSRKRVEIKVGTAYGSNPNVVLELMKNVALNHPDVQKTPKPLALFEGFGDSSLDFRLLFWVNYELGLGAKSDVAVGIYNTFAENDIEIPFPQVDLHIKEVVSENIEQKKTPKKVISKKQNKTKTKAKQEPLIDEMD